jgi:hypothetical protein
MRRASVKYYKNLSLIAAGNEFKNRKRKNSERFAAEGWEPPTLGGKA